MTDRSKGLKRILRVQDQLKRMADWRFAEAERAANAVDAARLELAAFLDANLLTGGLASIAAAQARRLDARGEAAAVAVTAEAEARRDVAARQKLVAKAAQEAVRDEGAARERKELERLIEGFAARRGFGDGAG